MIRFISGMDICASEVVELSAWIVGVVGIHDARSFLLFELMKGGWGGWSITRLI